MRMTNQEAAAFFAKAGITLDLPAPKKRSKNKPAVARHGGRDPEAELYWYVHRRWGSEAVREYTGAVPGRRFRIDIALPALRIAVEVDGWQFHGKHKRDFHRDREKRNLLAVNDWAVLAFSARDVFSDPLGVVKIIAQVVQLRRAQSGNSD